MNKQQFVTKNPNIHKSVMKEEKLLTWFWTTKDAALYRSRISLPGSPVTISDSKQ